MILHQNKNVRSFCPKFTQPDRQSHLFLDEFLVVFDCLLQKYFTEVIYTVSYVFKEAVAF